MVNGGFTFPVTPLKRKRGGYGGLPPIKIIKKLKYLL
jgi:hypothetical protein